MKILVRFIGIWVLSLPLGVFAQQKNIIQLRQILKKLEEKSSFVQDTQYIKTLNQLAFAYRRVKPDSTLFLAQKAQILAKKVKFAQAEAEALRMAGIGWFIKGSYQKALYYYAQALDKFKKNKDKRGIGATLSNIGMVYYEEGNYDKTLEYHFEGLKNQEAVKDTQGMAITLNFIGMTYHNQDQQDKAIEYHLKSLNYYQLLDNQLGIATSLHHIGSTYEKKNSYSLALNYYQQALKIRQIIGDTQGEAFSQSRLGNIHIAVNQLDSALICYRKALQIQTILADKQGQAVSLKELAQLYFKQKKYTEAQVSALKSLEIAQEIKAKKEIQEVSELLAQLYENQGDFAQALKYYKNFKIYSDSLFNKSKSEEIGKIEAQREFEVKEQKRILIQNKKDLEKENQLIWQRWLSTSVLGALLTIASIALLLYRNNRQKHRHNLLLQVKQEEILAQNEELLSFQDQVATQRDELLEKNQVIENQNVQLKAHTQKLEDLVNQRTQQLQDSYHELDTFLYRSSHDLRRPLTTIMGLSQLIEISTEENTILQLCDKTRLTAQNMDKMLRKLQFISELNNEDVQELEEVNLDIFIEKILLELRPIINQKNISVFIQQEIMPFEHCRANIFYAILYNLIENAVLFSIKEKAWVKIEAKPHPRYWQILVSDNGQGIAKDYQTQIFDMYVRANENSQGNGLGLYVVKKAVEKLEGKIKFSSQINKGSKFEVHIPIHANKS